MSESTSPADARSAFLQEVEKIVCKDRSATHGSPEQNFENIAALWSTFKGVQFTSKDVAAMMVLVKLGRIIHNPSHRDSWIDIAGYAACTASLSDKQYMKVEWEKIEKPISTSSALEKCPYCGSHLGHNARCTYCHSAVTIQ